MKVGISIDGDDFAEYYEATVVSVVDYYPFGSSMAGRKFNQGSYRYGFNGKEEDKEWGSQMIQDYGFRIYNPTIGKFLSVDPLSSSYPWYTPYQFAGNTPIWAIDLDGLEPLTQQEKDAHKIKALAAGKNTVLVIVGASAGTGREMPARTIIYTNVQRYEPKIVTGNSSTDNTATRIDVLAENFGTDNIVIDQSAYIAAWSAWLSKGLTEYNNNFNLEMASLFSPAFFKGGKFSLKWLKHADPNTLKIKGFPNFSFKVVTEGIPNSKKQQIPKIMKSMKSKQVNNLKNESLEGAIKDIHGFSSNAYVEKGHLTKVAQGLEGLKNDVKVLEHSLSLTEEKYRITGEARTQMELAVKEGKEMIKFVDEILTTARASAAKYADEAAKKIKP